MNLKLFHKILPVSKQVNIFDAKADKILEHLKIYDGGKILQEEEIKDFKFPSSSVINETKDEEDQKDNNVINGKK